MFFQLCSLRLLLLFMTINCIRTDLQNRPLTIKKHSSQSLMGFKNPEVLNKINCKKKLEECFDKSNHDIQRSLNHFNDIDSHVAFAINSYDTIVTTGLLEPQNNSHNLRIRSLINKKQSNSSELLENQNTTLDEKAREDAYRKTEASEHPYVVGFLGWTEEYEWQMACSATLLTPEWVLTAAHCLIFTHYLVYAGVHNLTEAWEMFLLYGSIPNGSQALASDQFYPHPDYNVPEGSNSNDIGLIRLPSGGFNVTEDARPIDISTQPWTHRGYRNCVLTGYGQVHSSKPSPDDGVRKTQVLEVKKPCLCSFRVEMLMGMRVEEQSICTRPKLDFGPCYGDSGGGLICDGKVMGVVNQGFPFVNAKMCKLIPLVDVDECGGPDNVEAFTDTCPYLRWINGHVQLFNQSEISGCKPLKSTAIGANDKCHCLVVLSVILAFIRTNLIDLLT